MLCTAADLAGFAALILPGSTAWKSRPLFVSLIPSSRA